MKFVTLGHILYGTVQYVQGNLTITARASGERGQLASYSFAVGGASPVVTVDYTVGGAGTVSVVAPANTTEAQLVNALRSAPGFFQLFGLDLAGYGSGAVTTSVVQIPMDDGLLQFLNQRVPLPGPVTGIGQPFADRDMVATECPVGLLWPAKGEWVRFNPEADGIDEFKGTLMLGIAFSLRTDSFHGQNGVLDFYRRKLGYALKKFKHDGLLGFGPIEWGNTNTDKDEVAGTALEQARVRVVFSCEIKWSEPSREDEDLIYTTMQPPHIGLWLEPLSDPLGGGGTGGETLDTTLHVTQE